MGQGKLDAWDVALGKYWAFTKTACIERVADEVTKAIGKLQAQLRAEAGRSVADPAGPQTSRGSHDGGKVEAVGSAPSGSVESAATAGGPIVKGSQGGGEMTDRRFPLLLNAGIDDVVNWLTRAPSPIPGSPPSFPSEGGTIFVHQGLRRTYQPAEMVVEMDGTFIIEDLSDPSRNVVQPIRSLIEFHLLPLPPTRVELTTAKCWLPALEPYLERLLREIERRWGEAPSTPSLAAAWGDGGPQSAVQDLKVFHADLQRFRDLVKQREQAKEQAATGWGSRWDEPPDMEALRQQLVRRSSAIQRVVEDMFTPRVVSMPGLPGSVNIWNAALEGLPGLAQSWLLDRLGDELNRAIGRLEADLARPEVMRATEEPVGKQGSSQGALFVPTRPTDWRRWQALWRKVATLDRDGVPVTQMIQRLKSQGVDRWGLSEDTLPKIIKAGRAGLLDHEPIQR